MCGVCMYMSMEKCVWMSQSQAPGLARYSACVSPVQMASLQVWAGMQGVLLPSHPAAAEGRLDRAARLPCDERLPDQQLPARGRERARKWYWKLVCATFFIKQAHLTVTLVLGNKRHTDHKTFVFFHIYMSFLYFLCTHTHISCQIFYLHHSTSFILVFFLLLCL